MSKDIDFSKAPEGATHYGLVGNSDIVWYRNICSGGYEFYTDSRIGAGHFFDRWHFNEGSPEYGLICINSKHH